MNPSLSGSIRTRRTKRGTSEARLVLRKQRSSFSPPPEWPSARGARRAFPAERPAGSRRPATDRTPHRASPRGTLVHEPQACPRSSRARRAGPPLPAPVPADDRRRLSLRRRARESAFSPRCTRRACRERVPSYRGLACLMRTSIWERPLDFQRLGVRDRVAKTHDVRRDRARPTASSFSLSLGPRKIARHFSLAPGDRSRKILNALEKRHGAPLLREHPRVNDLETSPRAERYPSPIRCATGS